MPKIIIDLPNDVNQKLKEKAKADYRSLTNYITVQLINLANDTIPTSTTTTAGLSQPLAIDLSTIPDGMSFRYSKPGKTVTSSQAVADTDIVNYTKRVTQLINLYFPEAKEDAHYYNDMLLPGIRPSVYGDTDDAIISTIKSFRESYLADDDDDEADLYEYQYDIETIREPKLVIPLNENSVYRKIKSYAIRNGLTDLLHDIIEYPLPSVEHYINDPDDEWSEKLIRPALESPSASDYKYEQEEISALNHALTWDDE